MPPELAAHWFGDPEEQRFEVWPDNWRAVEFFGLLSTQWNRDPAGGICGLNYPSVIALFDAYRVPVRQRARLLDDLRYIEAGALMAFNEKREREQQNGT